MSVQQGESMREVWASWQGHVLNGTFPLHRWLGSSDHSGVFLTELTLRNSAPVAIKVVPASATFADAQLAQWSAAALLDHPHLIRILETGQCQFDRAPYLYVVMEYADQTLAELLPRRGLTEPEAREMLVPALDALAFLHNRNLVQGQLKPANILAVGDQLKLASDTVCSVSGGTGGSVGTAYDPPEALHGSCSTASDVWALGVTLFEALAQRPPSLDERRAGVVFPADFPPAFRSMVTWCLSRRPYDRPKVSEIEAWVRRDGDSGPAAAESASVPDLEVPVPDLEVPELAGAEIVAPAAEPIELEVAAEASAAATDLGEQAVVGATGTEGGGGGTGPGEGAGPSEAFELAPAEADGIIETSFFELDEAVVPDPDAFEPIEPRANEAGGPKVATSVVAHVPAPRAHSSVEHPEAQASASRDSQTATSVPSQAPAPRTHSTVEHPEAEASASRDSQMTTSVLSDSSESRAHSSPGHGELQPSALRSPSAAGHGESQAPGANVRQTPPPMVSQASVPRAHSTVEHPEPRVSGAQARQTSTPMVSPASVPRAQSPARREESQASGTNVRQTPAPQVSQASAERAHSTVERPEPQASGAHARQTSTPIVSPASVPRAQSPARNDESQPSGAQARQTSRPMVSPGSAQRAQSTVEHPEAQASGSRVSQAHALVASQASPSRVPRPPDQALSNGAASRVPQAAQPTGSQAHGLRAAPTPASPASRAPAPRVQSVSETTGSHPALQRPHLIAGANVPSHATPQSTAPRSAPTPAQVVRLTPSAGAPVPAPAPAAVTSEAVQKAHLARSGVEFVSQRLVYTVAGQEVSVPHPRNGSLLPLALIAAVLLAVSWMGVRAIIIHRDPPPIVAQVLPADDREATPGEKAQQAELADDQTVGEAGVDPPPTAVSTMDASTDHAATALASGDSAASAMATAPSGAAGSITGHATPSAVSAAERVASTAAAAPITRRAAPTPAAGPAGPMLATYSPDGSGTRIAALSRQPSAPPTSNTQPPGTEAAGVAASSAVHEEIPDVPPRARRSIHGHVRVSVRVIVDKDGSVFAALVDEPGPSPYFAHIALEAAKQWTFPPADLQARTASERRWQMVRFDFTREGTTGEAEPVK